MIMAKYYWNLHARLGLGYYSVFVQAVPAFGDSEGFFTFEEIKRIQKEFDAIDNPDVQRTREECDLMEDKILKLALTEERYIEYKEYSK